MPAGLWRVLQLNTAGEHRVEFRYSPPGSRRVWWSRNRLDRLRSGSRRSLALQAHWIAAASRQSKIGKATFRFEKWGSSWPSNRVLQPDVRDTSGGSGRWQVVIFDNDVTPLDLVIGHSDSRNGLRPPRGIYRDLGGQQYGKAPVHFAAKDECDQMPLPSLPSESRPR